MRKKKGRIYVVTYHYNLAIESRGEMGWYELTIMTESMSAEITHLLSGERQQH